MLYRLWLSMTDQEKHPFEFLQRNFQHYERPGVVDSISEQTKILLSIPRCQTVLNAKDKYKVVPGNRVVEQTNLQSVQPSRTSAVSLVADEQYRKLLADVAEAEAELKKAKAGRQRHTSKTAANRKINAMKHGENEAPNDGKKMSTQQTTNDVESNKKGAAVERDVSIEIGKPDEGAIEGPGEDEKGIADDDKNVSSSEEKAVVVEDKVKDKRGDDVEVEKDNDAEELL